MEDWFTIDDIELSDDQDTLYCIAVDSNEHQFLAGNIDVPTHNTDEGKEQDELKGEAQMIIGSIARLGRAAGVHMVIATQRPDASLIPGETRDNLAVRLGCGPLQPNASSMVFGSNIGQRIRSNPKGGIYLQIHGKGNMGQGFFAPSDWLDKYYEQHPEVKAKVEGIHEENESTEDSDMGDIPESEGRSNNKKGAFEDDWDADMQAIEEIAHDNDKPGDEAEFEPNFDPVEEEDDKKKKKK